MVMQPAIFVDLLALAICWIVVDRITRHELRPGFPGPFNRAATFGGILLLASMLALTLAKQRSAWRELAGSSLPLPEGATHLVGWPPGEKGDGRHWVLRYDGTMAELRRFYATGGRREGWYVAEEVGDVALMLRRGDSTAMVGLVDGVSGSTLILALRHPR
jgi:hypothetical protein